MPDAGGKLLPRFRYGVIRPRAHEDLQRGPRAINSAGLCRSVQELSTGLGLENYTPEGVEKVIRNYWQCVELLAREKAGAQFRISDRLLARASAPPISNEKK